MPFQLFSLEINLQYQNRVLREMIVYSIHGWRDLLVCICILHLVCFGEEAWHCMHFLVILSLKTLWAGVKHWRTALHRFYVYRKLISSPWSRILKIRVIQKCVHLKCICVWCLDNWSRILSGKPLNTFSMARLKNIAISSNLHSPCHCHAFISYLSFNISFFMICDWGNPSFLCRPTVEKSRTMIGVFLFYSRDPRFDIRHWKIILVRRKLCHSTRCLFLYHCFVYLFYKSFVSFIYIYKYKL